MCVFPPTFFSVLHIASCLCVMHAGTTRPTRQVKLIANGYDSVDIGVTNSSRFVCAYVLVSFMKLNEKLTSSL